MKIVSKLEIKNDNDKLVLELGLVLSNSKNQFQQRTRRIRI